MPTPYDPDIHALLERAEALGVKMRPCDCEPCSMTLTPCPAVLTDLQTDILDALDPMAAIVESLNLDADITDPTSWHLEPGYSLDFLRILTGPVCESCWECEGRIVTDDDDHQSDHAERAWESMCSDFYGGSGGMSDREREERARDCGRRV